VPEAIGGREGAARDDVMEMGVKLEGSSPGVKDAEESREISADVVLIWSEFLDGVGGGFEQGRISHPLVLTDEAAEVVRDGESKQEMVTGELPFQLLFEPLLGLMVLTGRAMAIPTGAKDPMELAAAFALIKGDTTEFGATGDDGIHDFAV
jgi:hypothetical protein